MKVEVIAIGDEILRGSVVNTNAAYVSEKLLESGFVTERQTVLADEQRKLREGLEEALSRTEIVIAMGGLGPTQDDITRQTAAKIFDSPWHYDEKLASLLKKRYGESLISLRDQATVPTKALVLPNDLGTAPGLIFSRENTMLALLPGVPREMKAMLEKELIPFLSERFCVVERLFFKWLHYCSIEESSIDNVIRKLVKKYPKISFGSYPSQGIVSICLAIRGKEEREAFAEIEKPFEEMRLCFPENCYDSSTGAIEEAVHLSFIGRGLTLAVAESCTGGGLSARLTSLAGSSKYFLGSTVSYANEFKSSFLGVPKETLLEKGAVSREVVCEMAKGILEKSGADVALSVSGIAGPSGGSEKKPVGTIYFAIARREKDLKTWKFQVHGDRAMIIEKVVNRLLSQLWMEVENGG